MEDGPPQQQQHEADVAGDPAHHQSQTQLHSHQWGPTLTEELNHFFARFEVEPQEVAALQFKQQLSEKLLVAFYCCSIEYLDLLCLCLVCQLYSCRQKSAPESHH